MARSEGGTRVANGCEGRSEAAASSGGSEGPVSVVVPLYDCADYVVEAVESALAQTVPVEVIVVDDGSRDDGVARLAYLRDRITVIEQPNGGVASARNTGIRAARGEWIAFLDADDLWHPHKLAVQLDAARRVEGTALIGSPGWTDAIPAELPPDPPVRRLAVRDFLWSTPVCPSATLVRRGVLESVGMFDERLRTVEDRDLWLRIAARFPTVEVASPCWHYRRRPGQATSQPAKMLAGFEVVLDKFFRDHPEHAAERARAYGYMHLDAALGFLDQGDRRRAMRSLISSLRSYPWAFDGELSTALRRPKLLLRMALGEELFARLRRARDAFPSI